MSDRRSVVSFLRQFLGTTDGTGGEMGSYEIDDRDRQILPLLQRTESTSVDSITNRLVAEGGDVTPNGGRDAIGVELHDAHLPRLDAAGLLSYDSTTGRVEPSEASDDRLAPFLENGADER